jgi:hypothetical protein
MRAYAFERNSRLAANGVPLLPGEEPQSDLLEDAQHWAAVYEELTRFVTGLRLGTSDAAWRFQRRLDYWRRCRDELSGADAP